MTDKELAAWLNRTVLVDEPRKAVTARWVIAPGEVSRFCCVGFRVRRNGDEIGLNLHAQPDTRLANCIAVPELIGRPGSEWEAIIDGIDWRGRSWHRPIPTTKD